ncbi:MAG TPA: KamA family radical SAM protein [Pirellulaceae bacterium]|mgnify:CR=1 FL=1|nr:KamA family radical SAM protein [Pirellulaceae bacterium]HMO92327.1 KamA family radical SAM protein [Pirellulaceae bacterium]HMP69251.1 KamA family radical SAM protein [Pirellulaceae bacterium]
MNADFTLADLVHRSFRDDEFWKQIPAWENVTRERFADHHWQSKNSIKRIEDVSAVLQSRINSSLIDDILAALKIAPMNIRITPYVFSLIDWDNPYDDPLRKQFLPVASQMYKDHPYCLADSLYEDVDSPVQMLTHRYPDKVLFLPLTTCPVYCSYCTRSRIIGGSTDAYDKETYGPNPKSWEPAFEYLRQHREIEDVVISGGDAFNLTPRYISHIGEQLLAIPHIRRLRYATKGIAILPMKILTDDAWVNAFLEIHRRGRDLGKQVVIHTHFSSPIEITRWSQLAMERLFGAGVTVRNQAVLQEGVNNSVDIMTHLTRKLAYMNIQPYYVYIHDMVPGCEHLRTTLDEGIQLEKHVRGSTAGFNIPTFVCDAPAGGGKRHVSSYEHYDRENGISVWQAPSVKGDELFLYFDPLHKLDSAAQRRWSDEAARVEMINQAIVRVQPDLSAEMREKISKRLEGGVKKR